MRGHCHSLQKLKMDGDVQKKMMTLQFQLVMQEPSRVVNKCEEHQIMVSYIIF
jgi:hypothetical protein